MRRGKKREESAPPGAPLWMLTYGDMVTQILAFFILLFSFSSIDNQRFTQTIRAIQQAFGIFTTANSREFAPIVVGPAGTGGVLPRPSLDAVGDELQVLLQAEGVSEQVRVLAEERGVIIRFADAVLFDLGKDELRPEAKALLDRLAPVLAKIDNPISVEGYTDDLPIRTARFPSNWELSAARAVRVARELVERHGIRPERVSATGYGEYRPIVPNTSAANRRQNRRVELVILRNSGSGATGPAPSLPEVDGN